MSDQLAKFQAGKGSYLKEHLMFKWYMTENFILKVLKIAVLIYGFLLYLIYVQFYCKKTAILPHKPRFQTKFEILE